MLRQKAWENMGKEMQLKFCSLGPSKHNFRVQRHAAAPECSSWIVGPSPNTRFVFCISCYLKCGNSPGSWG